MSKVLKINLVFLFLVSIQMSSKAAYQTNPEGEIHALVIQKQGKKVKKIKPHHIFQVDDMISYTTNHSDEKQKGRISGFHQDSIMIQDEFNINHTVSIDDLSSIKRELSSSKKFLRFLMVLLTIALIIGLATQFLWYVYLGFVVGVGLALYVLTGAPSLIYGLATIPFLPFIAFYVFGIVKLSKYRKFSLDKKWKAEIRKTQ